MSTVVRTMECYPKMNWALAGLRGILAPEPNHAACPGGHHVSGVLGGWHCPCQCHRQESTTDPEPKEDQ